MTYYDKHDPDFNLGRIGFDALLALSVMTPIAILVFIILRIWA